MTFAEALYVFSLAGGVTFSIVGVIVFVFMIVPDIKEYFAKGEKEE